MKHKLFTELEAEYQKLVGVAKEAKGKERNQAKDDSNNYFRKEKEYLQKALQRTQNTAIQNNIKSMLPAIDKYIEQTKRDAFFD